MVPPFGVLAGKPGGTLDHRSIVLGPGIPYARTEKRCTPVRLNWPLCETALERARWTSPVWTKHPVQAVTRSLQVRQPLARAWRERTPPCACGGRLCAPWSSVAGCKRALSTAPFSVRWSISAGVITCEPCGVCVCWQSITRRLLLRPRTEVYWGGRAPCAMIYSRVTRPGDDGVGVANELAIALANPEG